MKDRPEPPLHPRRWWRWLLVIVVGMAVAYGGGLLMEWVREVVR